MGKNRYASTIIYWIRHDAWEHPYAPHNHRMRIRRRPDIGTTVGVEGILMDNALYGLVSVVEGEESINGRFSHWLMDKGIKFRSEESLWLDYVWVAEMMEVPMGVGWGAIVDHADSTYQTSLPNDCEKDHQKFASKRKEVWWRSAGCASCNAQALDAERQPAKLTSSGEDGH